MALIMYDVLSRVIEIAVLILTTTSVLLIGVGKILKIISYEDGGKYDLGERFYRSGLLVLVVCCYMLIVFLPFLFYLSRFHIL